jgi:hypothetical protein
LHTISTSIPLEAIKKKINGKEKSKLMEDVEIFVSNDIQERKPLTMKVQS